MYVTRLRNAFYLVILLKQSYQVTEGMIYYSILSVPDHLKLPIEITPLGVVRNNQLVFVC